MKRTGFFLVFICITLVLNANVFIDMYNQNYGKIDRSILIFDSKPKYRIIENDYDVQLNISNCKKDINIQNTGFPNNEVIESYDFYSTEDKVMVIITIDQSHDHDTNIKYRLDVFEEEGTYFKLILDIFATNTPKTYQDYVGFATYYEDTNRPEMALPYREMVNKLEAEMPELAQQQQETAKPVETSDSIWQYFTPGRLVMALIGLLLLGAVIYLIHHFRKPKEEEEEEQLKSLRELKGFGSEEFRHKIINKLKEYVWDEEAIAMEMEMETNAVTKILDSDLDAELERV